MGQSTMSIIMLVGIIDGYYVLPFNQTSEKKGKRDSGYEKFYPGWR